MVGVGDIGLCVGESQLERFDLQVHTVGGIDWQRRHIELLQDPERDQRDDALAIRRYLVDGVTTVGSADGADPIGAVCGKVTGAHDTAVGARVGLEFRREFATVEGLAVGRGDLLERGRVVGKFE